MYCTIYIDYVQAATPKPGCNSRENDYSSGVIVHSCTVHMQMVYWYIVHDDCMYMFIFSFARATSWHKKDKKLETKNFILKLLWI